MNDNDEKQMMVHQPQSNQIRLGDVQVNGPAQLVPVASQVATELVKIVDAQKLFQNISGKKYPKVEAWTTCAAMLGITPREAGVVERDGEFEATVELVNGKGDVVGRASAICGPDEPMWASRPRYARRSMAITRATGKACRLKYSWIMTLAGYEPTPAEEMDGVIDVTPRSAPPPNRDAEPEPEAVIPIPKEQFMRIGLEVEQLTQDELEHIIIPFGKNKGKTLGEVGKGIRWGIAVKWEPKPFKGKYNDSDIHLQQAAIRLRQLLGEDKE